jgi:hypothetical protein
MKIGRTAVGIEYRCDACAVVIALTPWENREPAETKDAQLKKS